MPSRPLSRRQLLSAASRAAVTLPFLSTFGTRAEAASGVAPLRLILLSSPFQFPEVFYHPKSSASPSTGASAGAGFTLNFPNSILAPLAPFQSDLLIFRGLKYGYDGTSHGSTPTTFTGSAVISPDDPKQRTAGTSIDNYLFGRMGRSGSLTPFMAGLFSYLYGGNNHDYSYSFNNGSSTAQTGNPLDLYNALFANFKAPGSSGTSSDANALATRRLAALGLVQKYVTSLSSQVASGSPSRTALQSHLSAAQGLTAQLQSSNSMSLPSCAPPAKSSISNDTGPDDGTLSSAFAENDFQSFCNIIVQALACDITRFGTFKLSDKSDPSNELIKVMPNVNSGYVDNWHDGVTHHCTGAASDPLTVALAQFKNYFMAQTAKLLTKLKAVADPFSPTQSLYDNTVVLIGSEGPISYDDSDSHGGGNADVSFIIAGGGGGYFKKGQLFFAGANKLPAVYHNALLTNVVNTFEKNQQDFNPVYTPKYVTQYGDYAFSVSPTSWLSP